MVIFHSYVSLPEGNQLYILACLLVPSRGLCRGTFSQCLSADVVPMVCGVETLEHKEIPRGETRHERWGHLGHPNPIYLHMDLSLEHNPNWVSEHIWTMCTFMLVARACYNTPLHTTWPSGSHDEAHNLNYPGTSKDRSQHPLWPKSHSIHFFWPLRSLEKGQKCVFSHCGDLKIHSKNYPLVICYIAIENGHL